MATCERGRAEKPLKVTLRCDCLFQELPSTSAAKPTATSTLWTVDGTAHSGRTPTSEPGQVSC